MSSTLPIHCNDNPRIKPVPPCDIPDDVSTIIDRLPGQGLKGENAPNNVLGTLVRNHPIARDFLQYWVTSKNDKQLSYREHEIIILRMGYLYQSNYIWGHHVKAGKESGLSNEEINALGATDTAQQPWSPQELVLIDATDEAVLHQKISDNTWNTLVTYFKETQILELIHIISQYVLFALVNNTFKVELESSIDGFRV